MRKRTREAEEAEEEGELLTDEELMLTELDEEKNSDMNNTPATSFVPEGVKQKIPQQRKEAVQVTGNDDAKLRALEEMLRGNEERHTEQVTSQQAGTGQFATVNQNVLQRRYLGQDVNVKGQDEKLGSFNSLLSQQDQVQSEIEKAMAMNTLDKKSELWRLDQLNNHLSALGTQFGLDVSSQRQYKKAKKIHRLSQQSSWI